MPPGIERRFKILLVSPECLADLLRLDGSLRLRFEGFPEDGFISAVTGEYGPAFPGAQFAFRVHSATFPEVLPGDACGTFGVTATETKDAPPPRGREFI